jgi:hypothetical protein
MLLLHNLERQYGVARFVLDFPLYLHLSRALQD